MDPEGEGIRPRSPYLMERDQPSYQLPEGAKPLTITEQFNIMAAQLDYWKRAYAKLWTEQRDD